jgi:hypothetical protein
MPFSSIKKNQYILLDGFHLLLADVFFKKAKKKKKKKKKKEKIYTNYTAGIGWRLFSLVNDCKNYIFLRFVQESLPQNTVTYQTHNSNTVRQINSWSFQYWTSK